MCDETLLLFVSGPQPPGNDDELSDGAIAGIIIAGVVALVLLVVLVVLVVVFLMLRQKNRSGKFKPSYETQGMLTIHAS